jgi:hypothetical protein
MFSIILGCDSVGEFVMIRTPEDRPLHGSPAVHFRLLPH